MGFSYKPLFRLLLDRNMKKTDLHTQVGLSSATLAKLSKGEPLSGESIEKLCVYFRCQVGELVEYIFEEPPAITTVSAKPAPQVQSVQTVRSARPARSTKTAQPARPARSTKIAQPAQAAQPAKQKAAAKRASKNRPTKKQRGAKP